MRLGISAKLFLAILSTRILVLIIMHWGVRVRFERGFTDYIRHGTEQRVQLMASELETLYAREGNWSFLRHNERMIFRIMRDIEQSSNPHGSLPLHGWRTPFWVIDANGRRLIGPQGSLPNDGIRSAIRYQGRDVHWVLTTPPERLTRNTDINFDRQQRRTSWFIVALATLLAAAVTLLLSRGMLAPVKRLIDAMHQLAAGNFATRVDVSSRDELGRLAQDFNQLATTLERNEQIRRALMADVSHDPGTPLAVLRGELEALQDGVRRSHLDSLTSLQAEVSTLTKLVNDLHQLSLSDAGALAYRKSPIEVSVWWQAAAGAFRDRLAAKGIRLTLRLLHEARVFGDPDRPLQMFNNLLQNSLRYTDSGGELQIVGQKSSDTLTLCWQDSAPGVSTEKLQHTFERFYRTEGSRSRSSGGSGLGLSICQNMVAAHGGRLSASHSPLGGVAMTVTLPLEAPP
ncbi:two-component system sensor histidine kinase BaeS [Edwardsiella ictaluri]|uniref:envelope stress sensor histidine kinase BaeS n=1 Tax=Edwardsiella ictaluri TaxID=67780 RepID=UPI003782F768